MFNFKTPVVVAPKTIAFLSRNMASAMAIFPIILVKDKDCQVKPRLLNHEKIHIRQQAELLIVFFYPWYFFEYLLHRLKGKNHYAAYRNISFEREAYSNENNLNYLQQRKFWAFIKWT